MLAQPAYSSRTFSLYCSDALRAAFRSVLFSGGLSKTYESIISSGSSAARLR